jgi:hypothetical protein
VRKKGRVASRVSVGVLQPDKSSHHAGVAATPRDPFVLRAEFELLRDVGMKEGDVGECLATAQPSHVWSSEIGDGKRSGRAVVAMLDRKHEGTNSLSKQNHVCTMHISSDDNIRFKPRAFASDTQKNRSRSIEKRFVYKISLAPNCSDLRVEVVEQLRREPASHVRGVWALLAWDVQALF